MNTNCGTPAYTCPEQVLVAADRRQLISLEVVDADAAAALLDSGQDLCGQCRGHLEYGYHLIRHDRGLPAL